MPFPNLPKLPNFLGQLPRFGDLLRDYRTLRGVSIEDLAATVNLAPSALRDIEAGKRPAPSKDIVTTLCDTLHLNKDERESLVDAAEMDSPVLHALMGRTPAKTALPSLTAAILVFLIADIRGYTHFTREQGDEAAARLTTRFADLARAACEQWDGHVVEVRGDEVLAVFASARQGLLAAHNLQARYAEEAHAHLDWPAGIGIGLDVGEAAQVDDGYRGTALNRAARLCSLAGPGEVLVSTGMAYVAPQVEGVTFVPRGQEQLKGFVVPVPILLAAPSADGVVESEPAPDAAPGENV
jgi:class 3 adenylate cyclase